MEVECNRHPGASTNDSQLLDETDFLNFFFLCPMAGKSWQPSHESPCRWEEGHPSNWYDTQWKQRRVGWVEQPRNYAQTQNSPTKNMRNLCTCDKRTPLTAQAFQYYSIYCISKHALGQVQEHTEKNTWERRPLKDALAQVPYKTPLGTKACWHRQMDNNDCRPLRDHKYSLLLTPLNYIWLHLKQIQYVLWLSIPYVIY